MGNEIIGIKKYKTILALSLFLVLLNFGIDYSFEYATDTYSTFHEKGTWVHVLYENGRPLKSLIFYIFETLNIPAGLIYHLSHFLGIIFLTFAVACFSVILLPYVKSEVLGVVLSFTILANPFIINFWLFEEKSLFMLIILLNVIAGIITLNRWTDKSNRPLWQDIVIIQICLWISVSMYQTGIFAYVVLLLPFMVIHSNKLKDFVIKNIFVAVMFGIPLATSFALAKFFLPVTRLGVNTTISDIFKTTLQIFHFVTFENFYNVEKGYFVMWLIILMLAVVFGVFAGVKDRLGFIAGALYITTGCVVVSFLLFLTGNSATCWPRMIYSYGMLFGVVSIYVLYEIDMKQKMSAAPKALIIALTVFILVYDYIGFGKVFLERHRANQEDLYYAEIIGQRIDEYEQKTGNTIDTLCYYKDHNVAVFAEGFNKTMLSERAQASGWSRHNSIEIYLDRKFTQGEPDPELEEKFSQEDWNMFSEKQLVFDGNTLHICVY